MEHKIEQLEVYLDFILSKYSKPILAWSGGKDSTFLLHLLAKNDIKIPVLMFPQFWTEEQKYFLKIVFTKYKLNSFFYSPRSIDFVDGKYMVANFLIANQEIPLVMDQLHNDKKCGLDIGKKIVNQATIIQPFYAWDATILGTKKSDRHPLIKDYSFDSKNTEFHTFLTPLNTWTDEEVLKAYKYLDFEINEKYYYENLEEFDTGTFHACMRCIHNDKIVFCPKENKQIKGVK